MVGTGGLVLKTNAAEITAVENNIIKDYYTTVGMCNLKLMVKKISKGVIIQMSYFIMLFSVRKPRKKQNNPFNIY